MASVPVLQPGVESWVVEPAVAVVRWGFYQAGSVPEAALVSASVVLFLMVFVVRRPVGAAVLFQTHDGGGGPLVQALGVFLLEPGSAWTPLDMRRLPPSVPQLVAPNRPVSKGSRSDYSRIDRQRGHVPSPVCIL